MNLFEKISGIIGSTLHFEKGAGPQIKVDSAGSPAKMHMRTYDDTNYVPTYALSSGLSVRRGNQLVTESGIVTGKQGVS